MDPYIAPSDIGRDWRAGSTGEQHTRTCQCKYCVNRRLDVLFFREGIKARLYFDAPVVTVLSPEFTPPAWLSC